jgi:hypothetical protein
MGAMARGGHGLPKVSPGPAMTDIYMPCSRALRPFQGWPTQRADSLQPFSTLLDTPRRMPMGTMQMRGTMRRTTWMRTTMIRTTVIRSQDNNENNNQDNTAFDGRKSFFTCFYEKRKDKISSLKHRLINYFSSTFFLFF